jgi:hypothetical protein
VKTLRFGRRFRGFESGALGGYVAGAIVGEWIEGPAEVNLRSLPPMDRDLELRSRDDGSIELRDGTALVAEAHPTSWELDVPEALSVDQAEAANERLLHHELGHIYPGCFTCGPDREEGDGLRLFVGRTADERLLAGAWTPHPDLADGVDVLADELVWAALDCPSIWAVEAFPGETVFPEGAFNVLARQRVEILAPVPVAEPAIVAAWPIESEGRKRLTGVAIHDRDGALLARGESLLVEVPRPK